MRFHKQATLLKKYLYLLITSLLFLTVSCSEKEKELIKFSISYHQDLEETATIYSIKETKMPPLKDPKIGFKNGVYWFKIDFLENIKTQAVVFDILENTIGEILIFRNNKIVPFKELDKTHPSLLIKHTGKNTYFLKVNFEKQVHFPLKIKPLEESQFYEKFAFFKYGLYYGFVFMVFVINIFFYFSFKDKTFLYYCLFVFCTNLCISDFDGISHTFLPSSFTYYNNLISHFLVSLTGALFAHQFLNLNYFVFRSKKTGMLLLLLAFISYILFLPTKKYVFIAIGDTTLLAVLSYYWILAIIIYKKHEFSKFFVIGYSLILFSALFFVIPINWGIPSISTSIDTVKFGALFEMLILTYSITYRIKILQQENQRYKDEIQKYLGTILSLEDTIQSSTIEPSIENKAKYLTEKYSLTKKEEEVLILISKGLTNQKIADATFTSLNTVKYHIRNLYQKLDIKNKSEVANIILES